MVVQIWKDLDPDSVAHSDLTPLVAKTISDHAQWSTRVDREKSPWIILRYRGGWLETATGRNGSLSTRPTVPTRLCVSFRDRDDSLRVSGLPRRRRRIPRTFTPFVQSRGRRGATYSSWSFFTWNTKGRGLSTPDKHYYPIGTGLVWERDGEGQGL